MKVDKYATIFGVNWLVGLKLLRFMDVLGKETCGPVADIGCGHSPYRHFFNKASRYDRYDVYPVDNNVILSTMIDIKSEDDSYQVLLLLQALSDEPKTLVALQECYRVLEKGGRVVIFESLAYPLHDLPNDYYRLLPTGVAYWAEAAGFEVEKPLYIGGYFTRLALTINLGFDYLINKLKFFGVVFYPGIAMVNIIAFLLDKGLNNYTFASDYILVLEKP